MIMLGWGISVFTKRNISLLVLVERVTFSWSEDNNDSYNALVKINPQESDMGL